MCGIAFKGVFAYIADCLMPNFFTLSFSFSFRLEFLFQHSLMFPSITMPVFHFFNYTLVLRSLSLPLLW